MARLAGEGGASDARGQVSPQPPQHFPPNSILARMSRVLPAVETSNPDMDTKPSKATVMFKAHADKMEELSRRKLSDSRVDTERRRKLRLQLFPPKKSAKRPDHHIQQKFRMAFQESLADAQRHHVRMEKRNACCLVAADEYSNFSTAAMQPLIRSRNMNKRLVEINQELYSKLTRREQQLREAAEDRQHLYARIAELESQMGYATDMLECPIRLLQQRTENLTLEPADVSTITVEERSVSPPAAPWTEKPDLTKQKGEYVEYELEPKQEMKLKKEEMKY